MQCRKNSRIRTCNRYKCNAEQVEELSHSLASAEGSLVANLMTCAAPCSDMKRRCPYS